MQLRVALWTVVIVRYPPRCLVSSWKPAPRWSGGSVTTVAPPKLVPSDLKLALESFYLPWFGQKTRFCLCDHFFTLCHFFVSHTVSTIEAGLMALEDGLSSSLPPRTRVERPRGLNPRLYSLSGHGPYIWHWVKTRGPFKVTKQYRLEEF